MRDSHAATRAALAALLVAVTLTAASGAAPATRATGGWRAPTSLERLALGDATHSFEVGDKAIQFIRVSLADSNFAVVGWTGPADPKGWLVTSLFGRSHGHWRLRYHISARGSADRLALADGACAVAPSAVVRALYDYRCSFTWRQLHARLATRPETRSLQAALTRYFSGGSLPSHARIHRGCISRVDSNWAAADAPGYVWFKKHSSGWRVIHFEGDPTPGPPHAIVLSLGSCVGYFASDYY